MSPPGRPGPPPYVIEARRLAVSGRPREALAVLDGVLRQNPKTPPALRVSAEILLAMGAVEPALQVLERFRGLAPNAAVGHLLSAQAQELARDHEAAAASLETAHRLRPELPDPPALRARLAERANDLDGARVWVDLALRADPNHPTARMMDGKLHARTGKHAEAVQTLRKLAADANAMARLAPAMRSAVHHEIGQALDKSGDYANAWEAFGHASRERANDPSWAQTDARQAFDRIERTRSMVRSQFLESCPAAGEASEPSPRVVFLVGLPRSGTTLTERVLAGCPGVMPTDEQTPLGPVLIELRKRSPGGYHECLPDLTDEDFAALRTLYFEHARRLLGEIPVDGVLLDKLPLNLIDLPLIARLFPASPLVMALREPLDACLSNAQQLMAPNPSMKALGELGTGSEYAAALLGMWCEARERLRMPWIESRYEDLVSDPDTATARLIAHCGLKAGEGGAMPARSEAIIGTPSYEAVTAPINTRAVGRWAKYGDAIGDDLAGRVETTLADVRSRLGYT